MSEEEKQVFDQEAQGGGIAYHLLPANRYIPDKKSSSSSSSSTEEQDFRVKHRASSHLFAFFWFLVCFRGHEHVGLLFIFFASEFQVPKSKPAKRARQRELKA